MFACKIARGSVNGDTFIEFVEKLVMPNLLPIDGYKPRRVLIMDNCSIHDVDIVIERIQQTGL